MLFRSRSILSVEPTKSSSTFLNKLSSFCGHMPFKRLCAKALLAALSGLDMLICLILGLLKVSRSGISLSFSAIQMMVLKKGLRLVFSGMALLEWDIIRALVKRLCSRLLSISALTDIREAKSMIKAHGLQDNFVNFSIVRPSMSRLVTEC